MSSIDNRIVEMQFDNKQFEEGIQTSTKSLNNFKKALKLEDSAKGLENLESVGKHFSLSNIADSVDTISNRFSALGIMGVTALQNITNSAINAGKQMASAFTIDPVKSGFQEYETQINAVQTILANTENKGSTLQDVNAALDELNYYADKTIYNFTEMTRNIGTFTAAGVDLETSTAAIKGIANLAAVSGSTSQQASTAMYQLSQALAAGTVKLLDWNSVVTAGMGGEIFKESLKETARVHGIAIDQMIEQQGSFRETLSKGWLTSEILTETLSKFTGDLTEAQLQTMGYNEEQIAGIIKMGQTANDAATKVKTFTQLFDTLKEAAQSGWTQSWELIVGDFEEAKELLTGVSNTFNEIIEKSAESRNNLLEGALKKSGTNIAEWKKLENTGFASAAFQKALIDAAKTHGIAIDEMIEEEGSFANTLKNGWLNIDIFNDALDTQNKMLEMSTSNFDELKDVASRVINGEFGVGEDRINALTEAGYDFASVQAIVNHELLGTELNLEELNAEQLRAKGYTDEEIAALEELARQAQETGTPINELMESLSKPSGRELLIDSFKNSFTALSTAIGTVKSAFHDIFPPMTAERLYNIIEGVNEFTKKLKTLSLGSIPVLTRSFRGFFSMFDIFGQMLSAGLYGLQKIGNYLLPFGKKLAVTTGKFGDFVTGLSKITKQSDIFRKSVDKIAEKVKKAKEQLEAFTTGMKERFDEFRKTDTSGLGSFINSSIERFAPMWDTLKEIKKRIADTINDIRNIDTIGFDAFYENVKMRLEPLSNLAGIVKEHLNNLWNILKEFIQNASKDGSFKLPDKTQFKELGEKIKAEFSSLDGIGEKIKTRFASISSALSAEFSSLDGLGEKIKTRFSSISSALSVGAEWIGKGLSKIWEVVNTIFEKIDFQKLANTFLTLGGAKLLFSLSSFASKFSKIIKSFANISKSTNLIFKNVAKSLDYIPSAIKAWNKNVKASAILKLAGAIAILAGAVALLSFINPDKIVVGLEAVSVLVVEIAALMVLFDKTLGKSSNMKAIGTSLASMAGALLMLSAAMLIINRLDWPSINKGLVVIGVMCAELALFMNVMDNADFKLSNGLALIAFAKALSSMVSVIKKISKVDIWSLVKGLIAVGALCVELAGFMRLIDNNTFNFGSGVGLLALTFAISSLVGSIKKIGKINLGTLAKGLIGIGALCLELGAFMKLMDGNKFSIGSGLGLATLAISLSLLASAVEKFGSINTGNLIKGLSAIGGVLLGLGAFVKMVGNTTISLKTALILGSIALLVPLFQKLSEIPNVTSSALSISGTLLALAEAFKLFSTVNASGIMSAFGSILAITAVITAISGIAGALEHFTGLSSLINEGATLLGSLGNAIGSFVGGITGGFNREYQNATSDLPTLAEKLSEFATNITPFLDSVNNLETGIVDSVGTLATAILKITAAEVLDAIANWISGSGSLKKFGESLKTFGTAINEYYQSVKNIGEDTGIITATANAAEALVTLEQSLPNVGGLIQKLAGYKDLGLFGTQLELFGKGLNQYYTSVGDVNAKKVKQTASAAQGLADLYNDLPNIFGVVQVFTGFKSLRNFGSQLKSFGQALADYSSSAETVNTSDVKAVTSAATELANLYTSLPNIYGVIEVFTGFKSLKNFGSQLKSFGQALADYSSNVEKVDAGKMTEATAAAQGLADLYTSLPNIGGIIDWFTGRQDLGAFGEQLKTFGEGLSGYYNSISTVNPTDLTAINTAIESLISMADVVANTDSYNMYAFTQNLETLRDSGMKYFFESFSDMGGQDEGAGESLVAALVSAIQNAVDAHASDFGSSGENTIKAYVDGLESSVSALTTTAETTMQQFSTTLANASIQTLTIMAYNFVAPGVLFITNLVNGMQSMMYAAKEKSVQIARAAAESARSVASEFESSGRYLVEGLARGLENNASIAQNAAQSVARKALDAANAELEVRSPSKAFERTGMYADMGLARGFLKYSGTAQNAASTMAESAINAVKFTLNSLSNMIQNEVDMDPVIHPVIDLTDVSYGINTMNGMLKLNSGNRSLNLLGRNAELLNQTAYNQSQNQNADVVNAIRSMNGDILTLKDAILNMKVVMQNGALVGQIVNPLDRRFGKMMGYEERGI